jgi:hypothetical protein
MPPGPRRKAVDETHPRRSYATLGPIAGPMRPQAPIGRSSLRRHNAPTATAGPWRADVPVGSGLHGSLRRWGRARSQVHAVQGAPWCQKVPVIATSTSQPSIAPNKQRRLATALPQITDVRGFTTARSCHQREPPLRQEPLVTMRSPCVRAASSGSSSSSGAASAPPVSEVSVRTTGCLGCRRP